MKAGCLRISLLTAALLGCLVATGNAQGTTPDSQPPLPDGTGAWRVELTTSGGFDGTGAGNITADSSGFLKCSLTKHACPEKLSDSVLRGLSEKVKAASAAPWQTALAYPLPSLCSDCLAVHLQLTMRMPNGIVRTFMASWDTTSGTIADPLLALYKSISALGTAPQLKN